MTVVAEPYSPDDNARLIDLPNRTICIPEFSGLQDECGAVIWDAALVLANYLIEQAKRGADSAPEMVITICPSAWLPSDRGKCLVSGHVCVELGSGTGAVGLVAAGLGASHVILTELAHLVPYLRDNVKVNNLGSTASVSILSWGDAAELATLQQRLPGLRPCTVLLASDVIYELAHIDGLMSTMRSLMDKETLLLLSIEDRAPAEEWRWREKLKGHGLVIAREVGLEEMSEDWRDPAIHVLEIRCC